ncbi:MAG: hypothetical protein MZV64_71380 [Ignavibacteriales bacterium]|nr:hypothetical protein [Ignavibacteriales bacterium]
MPRQGRDDGPVGGGEGKALRDRLMERMVLIDGNVYGLEDDAEAESLRRLSVKAPVVPGPLLHLCLRPHAGRGKQGPRQT